MKKIKRLASLNFKLGYLSLALAIAGLVGTAVYVHADQFDAQINALQQQNNSAQANINNLAAQAGSYQGAINSLQAQIDGIQATLAINQAKQTSLQGQIDADKANIALQKQYLGDDLKTMYIDGQLSTIEELATSKNLSDYVDKQEYRSIVQDKVDSLIKQIADLENQLQHQKELLDILVNTETEQNNQLSAAQSQQQQLLSLNESQQSQYDQQIQSNQSQIAQLRQEQIAANRKLVGNGTVDYTGSCGGSYPSDAANANGGHWGCNYGLDNTLDNWGMYNRECVSYTAWMVYKTYGYMPYWGGSGNANEWPGDARAAGIPTGSTPKVGSVAIYMGGSGDPFGHAMWVDSVNGNGTITVSQYNLYYDGNYYQTTISSSGLTYIYFGG